MIDDKYRARVLEAMEDEYGPAETPEQEEVLLGTYRAAALAFEFAREDFVLDTTKAVREQLGPVGERLVAAWKRGGGGAR